MTRVQQRVYDLMLSPNLWRMSAAKQTQERDNLEREIKAMPTLDLIVFYREYTS